MIAYAEAGGEGSAGMLAVMKVVRNRIANLGFADDACAVALEPGQFQTGRANGRRCGGPWRHRSS